MSSSDGPRPEDLERDAAELQRLIDDARTLQRQITDQMEHARQREKALKKPAQERRKQPR